MDRTEYNRLYARKRRNSWTEEQRESANVYARDYNQKNKDKINAQKLKKYHSNPEFRLACNLRKRLTLALKRGSKIGSAIKDLGCTIEELKKHLESLFQPGMTWDNYTYKGWHIDHIRPLSSFNLNNPEEFKKANHFSNLQPMWAKDNIKKKNKY